VEEDATDQSDPQQGCVYIYVCVIDLSIMTCSTEISKYLFLPSINSFTFQFVINNIIIDPTRGTHALLLIRDTRWTYK
jgi:hypothetical protein